MPKVHECWSVLPHEPVEHGPAAVLNAVADSLEESGWRDIPPPDVDQLLRGW
ncbi:MAG TPA: hypothetical protein VF485_16780 [Sphingomonas sp.]